MQDPSIDAMHRFDLFESKRLMASQKDPALPSWYQGGPSSGQRTCRSGCRQHIVFKNHEFARGFGEEEEEETEETEDVEDMDENSSGVSSAMCCCRRRWSMYVWTRIWATKWINITAFHHRIHLFQALSPHSLMGVRSSRHVALCESRRHCGRFFVKPVS